MLVLVLGSLLPGLAAQAQLASPEARLASAVTAARQRYTESFGGHPQLYNGPEYVDYARRYHARTNHQFFLTPEMQPGSVHYNGQLFGNVRLTYDVVRDQVVLAQPTSPLTLSLINENVRGFAINDRRFVRLRADSTAGGVIRTGYYEVLADGRAQLLARRAKRQQEQIVQGFVDVEFIPTDRLYLQKDGVYYAAGRKAAVLRLLADHGKEVQQYVQERHLSFKKARFEVSMAQLVSYYNGLPAH